MGQGGPRRIVSNSNRPGRAGPRPMRFGPLHGPAHGAARVFTSRPGPQPVKYGVLLLLLIVPYGDHPAHPRPIVSKSNGPGRATANEMWASTWAGPTALDVARVFHEPARAAAHELRCSTATINRTIRRLPRP